MSRNRLADLSENINSGIYRDPGNDRVPLWADGKNIVFDPAGPRPVHGFSRLTLSRPTSIPIRGQIQARIGSKDYIFFGDKNNLYRYDDGAGTIQTVSKATDAYGGAFWTFDQWGDWILATNNVDAVQLYKESVGNFADLGHDLGGTLTAEVVLTTKVYAILFGTDSEGREVRWSDEDDVNTYASTLSNAAGSLFIRGIQTPIKAAMRFQQGAVFYGINSAHMLQWTGPPYYFGEFVLPGNAGVVGKHAVISVRNVHYGIGLQSLWMMQPGQQPEPIGKPQIHKYVYDDLDFDNMEKCVVWYDQQQELIVFSYPSLEDGEGEPTRSVALSLQSGAWSPLDFAPTSAAFSPVFQYTSAADYLGGVYWHGVPGAGGGLPFDTQAYIEMTDDLTVHNYYGLSGYGKHDYGGP